LKQVHSSAQISKHKQVLTYNFACFGLQVQQRATKWIVKNQVVLWIVKLMVQGQS